MIGGLTILQLIFMIVFLLILVGIASGTLMLWRVPTPPTEKKLSKNKPRVSIIIPARDEEGRIEPLLASIKIQTYQPLEVIVVDDDSKDRTAIIANSYGAKVIRTVDSDLSWVGKSAACWLGSLESKGVLLLFLDADTRFEHEESLEDLISSYEQLGSTGIFSLQPYHRIQHYYENLSAIFNLLVLVGMNIFTRWGNRFEVAGSFGPCILTARKEYFHSGGFRLVGPAIMDDFELSRIYKKAGYATHCFGGQGIIHFQMYPEGPGQLVEGWTKNFGTASQSTHPVVMTLITLWISGGFLGLPFVLLTIYSGSLLWIIVSILCYILYMIHLYFLTKRVGHFYFSVFLFYPALFLFFSILFLWSVLRTKIFRSVTWKGRRIKV